MRKAFLAGLMLFSAVISYGEITNEIRYTARLKGYASPITTQKRVEFRYYKGGNENGGGTQLYSETKNVTPNSGGIFTVTLNPAIKYGDWREGDIWVQIYVEDKGLLPREKLMAQPYAIHAKTAENGVPAGTVIAFAGDAGSAPSGYLLCDGREVNQSDYPDLFAAIGSLYGTASGGKFKVPDFRGMFLRGAGEQTLNYGSYGDIIHISSPIGIAQGTAIKNLTGELNGLDFHGSMSASGIFGFDGAQNSRLVGAGSSWTSNYKLNASRVVPTSTENRPANYAVNYYIKY
jgi:hypothetical protein